MVQTASFDSKHQHCDSRWDGSGCSLDQTACQISASWPSSSQPLPRTSLSDEVQFDSDVKDAFELSTESFVKWCGDFFQDSIRFSLPLQPRLVSCVPRWERLDGVSLLPGLLDVLSMIVHRLRLGSHAVPRRRADEEVSGVANDGTIHGTRRW